MREKLEADHEPLTAYIPILVLLVSGALLLIMNLLYAQKSITEKIYGKRRSKSFIKELRSTIRLARRKNKFSQVKKELIARSLLRRQLTNWIAQCALMFYFVFIIMLIMVQFYSSKSTSDRRTAEDTAQVQLVAKLSESLNVSISQNRALDDELNVMRAKIEAQNAALNSKSQTIDLLNKRIKNLNAHSSRRQKTGVRASKAV
ncbi:hypothetical protein AO263_29675 [Pseudomonas sp. NZIPFR-PS5]|nr:hypothetical protein AO263_29675 [Pseudomonas sp. NZIPFR-PS5]